MTTDELRSFCLHYSEWKDICQNPSRLKSYVGGITYALDWSDPTGEAAYILEIAKNGVELIERCCRLVSPEFADDILAVVTEDYPPEMFDVSRELYARFFCALDAALRT